MTHTALGTNHKIFETKSNFAIRVGTCIIAVLIHLSLFRGQDNPWLWTLVGFQAFVYAPLLHFLPVLRCNANRNLLIDTALYSFCLGIWGFNLHLVSGFASAACLINLAAGGVPTLLRATLILIAGGIVGGAVSGFYYRPDLPLSTQFLVVIGLLLFMTVIGLRIHAINKRLRNVRDRLQNQREELLNLNTLALAVNAHMDVDTIMHSVMQTMERLHPFEALYILAFNEPAQRLEVLGIYGSTITEQQHNAFRKLKFDLVRDHNSMFVKALLRGRAICIPELTPELVKSGDKIDYDLYCVKPSVSIAYFPIFVEDKVVAGAAFINYEKPFNLTRRDMDRIQQLLVQVGTAVRNATLFKELEIAKEKAEIAQQKAQASEETKSRFLANMSHEIRTPLTAIMGYSEALAEEGITAEERNSFIGYILRSGKHLLSMINDILDISKIDAHKIEIEQLPSNLLEVLCDIDSYMKIKTRDKNLQYILDIDFPIPATLITDPTRLKQILLNLCNNAVKFTAQGSIKILARMQADEYLQICISDTGIGIGDNEKNRIFSAFDQADTSTTRLFGGTGLGLYISKNLAQLLGGDLTVESEKGVGSTFILQLPVGLGTGPYIRNSAEFADRMADIIDSKTYGGIPRIGGSALVAEDNQENQRLVERLLRQAGMEVDLVDNGVKAVEAAKQKPYSLILMDMQMPVMSGTDAARAIQALGIQTPIVAFTANVMTHQIEEYQQLGFAGVVEKPIIREKLFATLKQLAQPTKGQQCRVLIVDDNEVNQMILFRYITKANEKAEVTLAADGETALELIRQHKFDLILMDMEMPIMDGLTATQQIRAQGNDSPIYIVSGNVSHEDRARCLEAGATGHIAKPLDKDQIYQIMQNLKK